MTRKLPIGIQSFEGLRKDGYLYVDKTSYRLPCPTARSSTACWRASHPNTPPRCRQAEERHPPARRENQPAVRGAEERCALVIRFLCRPTRWQAIARNAQTRPAPPWPRTGRSCGSSSFG